MRRRQGFLPDSPLELEMKHRLFHTLLLSLSEVHEPAQ